jgi:hypothetical protein
LAVATRTAVSIGVAVLVVMATVVPASTVSPAVKLSADSTALLLCGTACPTWNDAHVEVIKNQFIAPTHPGQDIDYVAVTAPMEAWPITGLLRVLGLLGFGDPGCGRPGGDCWPDEPLWKLSGLFDLTTDQSIQAGVGDLEQAMAAGGNDHLVIYGDSQGAIVANVEKRKLAEQYPDGTAAPDIDFVLTGDWNVPNGGLHARFPGFYIPILDWTFDGPEPTNTQFHTDVIIRQYDGVADFPLYPLNVIATLNALLGVVYVHPFLFDVSLADETSAPATVSQHGDTTYYFFENPDLPLFGPLRTLGVPESLIDVVEPFFRVIVELGYDRSIRPWEPTPARLIPPLDPAKVITDLVNAIGEGANNALALIGLPPLLSIPAAPAEITRADVSDQTTTRQQATDTDQTTTRQQATQTDETTTRQQITDTDETTTRQQITDTDQTTTRQQITDTDQTTTRQQITDTDQTTTRQQITDTDQTTTPTVSTSKPWKRAGRHETPRPLVRGPLGVHGQQIRGRQHSGDADAPTPHSAAADVATTTGTSSPASSSVRSSPGARSPGGDTDGS